MRRAFGFGVLPCPRCGRDTRLIALIEAGEVSRRVLPHLGKATGVPAPAPARAPSQAYEYEDDTSAQAAPPATVDRRFQEPMSDDPR